MRTKREEVRARNRFLLMFERLGSEAAALDLPRACGLDTAFAAELARCFDIEPYSAAAFDVSREDCGRSWLAGFEGEG